MPCRGGCTSGGWPLGSRRREATPRRRRAGTPRRGRATGPRPHPRPMCTTSGRAKGRCARTGSHQDLAPPPHPHGHSQPPTALRSKRPPPGSPCASRNPTRRPHRRRGARRDPPPQSPSVPPAPSTRPGGRDPVIDLAERPHHTARRRTASPPLVPHEARRAPALWKVHQPHWGQALRLHRPAAVSAGRPGRPGPDMQRQRPAGRVVDAEDIHLAQTDEQLADTMLLCLSSGVLGEPVLVASGEVTVVVGASFEF